MLAVVALGENGDGAHFLARITQKSRTELELTQGQRVYARSNAYRRAPRVANWSNTPLFGHRLLRWPMLAALTGFDFTSRMAGVWGLLRAPFACGEAPLSLSKLPDHQAR